MYLVPYTQPQAYSTLELGRVKFSLEVETPVSLMFTIRLFRYPLHVRRRGSNRKMGYHKYFIRTLLTIVIRYLR